MRKQLGRLNSLAVIVTLLVLFLGTLHADMSRGGMQRERGQREQLDIEEFSSELQEKLSLSEEQLSSLKEILTEHKAELEKLQASTGEGERPSMEEMKALHDKLEEKILSILDEGQQEKYLELREEMRPERSKRGRGRS